MTKLRVRPAENEPVETPVRPIRALVADDHPPIIEGLTIALGREGIDVVGQATTPNAVLQTHLECTPDVIVLDIRYAHDGRTGLDVARELLQHDRSIKIVIYTQFDTDELVREAYRIGCAALVTKGEATATLAEAIRIVYSGKTYFQPDIAERLAMIGLHGDTSPLGHLEPREFQVFKLMAQGHTNVEIAEALGLSPRTISITSQAVKDKLRLSRQADLTLLAVKHQVIGV